MGGDDLRSGVFGKVGFEHVPPYTPGHFIRCGYPFDSGNHNKLWSSTVGFSRADDRHVSAWLDSHCLLQQAKEELPPASRSPTIEAEREFIQIVIQMFQTDGPLMRA